MKLHIIFISLICNFMLALDFDFNTLKGDFQQVVQNKSEKITYEGNFQITKKEAFWNYNKPTKKLIYLIDKKLVVIEPDIEQAIISKVSKIPNLSEILTKAKKNGDKFTTKYDDVEYTIIIKNNIPISINYIDKVDNVIAINLSNVEKDKNINNDIFKYKIPDNFDIIQE